MEAGMVRKAEGSASEDGHCGFTHFASVQKSRRERWRHLMAPHFVTCGGALEHNGAAVATAALNLIFDDDFMMDKCFG